MSPYRSTPTGSDARPSRIGRGRLLRFALATLLALPVAAIAVTAPATAPASAATAAPVVISRNVPAFASANGAEAKYANDHDYRTEWRSYHVPAWLAYDLSAVPSASRQRVLAAYSNLSYGYSTSFGAHYNNLGSYTIQVSNAPGGGAAPTTGWTTKVTVTGNTLHSRQHVLDLEGANWVRINITASDGSPQNTDISMNTFDLYDLGATTGPVTDSFVFYGDSITAAGMCQCPGDGVDALARLINQAHPTRWPVMENAGDPFLNSGDAVSLLLGDTGQLSMFPGTHVGLSFGMNDAAGNGGQDAYYANMRRLVTAVLAQGKVPMIPTIGYTNDAGRNAIIPSYNAVIDRLYAEFPEILRGPDFWTFYRNNPTLLGTNDIHPNGAGYAAMRQQWANTLLSTVYTTTPTPTSSATVPAAPAPTASATPTAPPAAENSAAGLHAAGSQILDATGRPVRLIGVNHSGTEYACVGGGDHGATGYAMWEPADFGTNGTYLDAMKPWGINTVRIGLNETCWLGINGVAPAYSGANYQASIKRFVDLATSKGFNVVLELHWSAPGTGTQFVAHGQSPMPNRDHTVTMWQQVANAYKGNTAVVLDLFNEPYPHWNQDTANAWQCWRDGSDPADPTNSRRCIGTEWWDKNGNAFNGGKGYQYQVAGMQELVTAVRGTGAQNLILLGGLQYANNLSQWLTYMPNDPANNLAASWHVYPFNICSTQTCWDAQAAPVANAVPLVVGEIGDSECRTTFAEPLMTWLDQRSASYLAWTWNQWGCSGMQLMTDYTSGTPTAFGKPFYDHFRRVAATMPTSPPPAPTPTPTATVAPTPSPTATVAPTPSPSTGATAPPTASPTPSATASTPPPTPSQTPSPAACPCSLWPNGTVPGSADADTNAVELGIKVVPSRNGSITAVRFYKPAASAGPHSVRVWTSRGGVLASAKATAGTAGGWQTVQLARPVPVTAGRTYVVSYHAPYGRYAASTDYFTTSGRTSGPLSAPASSAVAGNGVYTYGPAGSFPRSTYRSTNYWVDVLFS